MQAGPVLPPHGRSPPLAAPAFARSEGAREARGCEQDGLLPRLTAATGPTPTAAQPEKTVINACGKAEAEVNAFVCN